MQQRVALARALVIRPRVLLLDEPLAALDKKLREEMRAELKEIQQRVGVTTVFVTHDQHEALGLSDRIAVLNAGRLEQLGSPRDIYERPATRFVADFVGASTVLEAAATGGATVELAPGVRLDVKLERLLTHGERVRLLVRPERIELGAVVGFSGGNAVAARVTRVMYLGDHTEVGLDLPGGNRALATVRGGPPLAVGETVTAVFPSDAFMEVGQ
jgi:ABC-type Fe3+/spermidine/putrescine transport system ATPase subunit